MAYGKIRTNQELMNNFNRPNITEYRLAVKIGAGGDVFNKSVIAEVSRK